MRTPYLQVTLPLGARWVFCQSGGLEEKWQRKVMSTLIERKHGEPEPWR